MNKYNIVSDLQNYMFTALVVPPPPIIIQRTPLLVVPPPPIIIQRTPTLVVPIKKNPSPFFCPRQKDSLFWCFYVIANGFVSYEKEQATFAKEKVEKIKYITLLRNNKSVLKDFRIRKLGDIEANLSLEQTIDMNTFFALCALEKLNVVVIQNQTYSEIVGNTAISQIHIIHIVPHKGVQTFKLECEPREITNINYTTTHFKLPLKSVGTYKLSDLHDMCIRLKIIIPVGCKKKQDIYNLILGNINKID